MGIEPDELLKAGFIHYHDVNTPFVYNLLISQSEEGDYPLVLWYGKTTSGWCFHVSFGTGIIIYLKSETPQEAIDWINTIAEIDLPKLPI